MAFAVLISGTLNTVPLKAHKALQGACLSLLILFSPHGLLGQDSTSMYEKAFHLPDKFFGAVNRKAEKLEAQLARSTTKYLNKLRRQEKKMKRSLAKKDSAAAAETFGDIDKRYDSLTASLSGADQWPIPVYSGRLDSMRTALGFLQNNKVLDQSPEMQSKLKGVLGDYGKAQQSLDKTQWVRQQVSDRQQYLKDKLSNVGMVKQFRGFQEQVYYYRAQVDEYKQVFENPRKLEESLLKAAVEMPAFQKYFANHSQLGSLFRLPGADVPMTVPEGMQTREMLSVEIGQRLGSGPNIASQLSSSVASAQSGLDKAKKKIDQLGAGNDDLDMPNFKPNDQKTKSFLKRLELGTNLQSTRANNFFPVTSDMGLSIGYRISPKAVAGVGGSYKMGWGESIRKVGITHQGVGLRSFADVKLKRNLYITSGLEFNYQSPFTSTEVFENIRHWRSSGLIGISKVVALKTGPMNKTKLQLLCDLLSFNKVPRGQPILFRTNYMLR